MQLRVRWHQDHRERGHRIRRRVETVLVGCGIALLGFCALFYLQVFVAQVYEHREFERSLTLSEPLRTPSKIAASLVRLQIPRLGMSVMVHEGVAARTLSTGAGHIPGTASPGESGNIGIAAHRDLHFRKLGGIRPGDTVLLETLEGTYRYSVEWTRVVKPAETGVLQPSGEPVLTLVTCYPFYYVGPAPDRFIVRARRVGATE
jgi:LPXTG-site transpeptidase (sortase) family protein